MPIQFSLHHLVNLEYGLSIACVSPAINNNSNTTTKKLKTKFTAEGVDGEQELSGSVVDVIEQINGGLKSGLSYLGCRNINEVHKKAAQDKIKFNVVTSIGMSETGIRVKTY